MLNFPTVYKLITNDGEYIVPMHPSLEQLAEYYTRKFNSGMAIKDIKFKCIPFQPTNTRAVLQDMVS